MRKVSFLIFVFTILCNGSINAQNTLAKIKFEDAEKAFYDAKYEECIKLLDETEEILGQGAPNILYLRIIAGNKILEANPNRSFSLIAGLRNQTKDYLTNYDIAGLEEKYREVYEISNLLKGYTDAEAVFNQKRDSIESQRKIVTTIIENYLDAIGGLDKINSIKSIYKIADPKDNEWTKNAQVEKYLFPNKILRYFAKAKKPEEPIIGYVYNDLQGQGHEIVGKNRTFREKYSFDAIRAAHKALRIEGIPERLFLDKNYRLTHQGEDANQHKLLIEYPDGSQETRYYNRETHLLTKLEFQGSCFESIWSLSDTYINGANTIIEYSDYRETNGIKFPYTVNYISHFSKRNGQAIDYQRIQLTKFDQILINQNVNEADF